MRGRPPWVWFAAAAAVIALVAVVLVRLRGPDLVPVGPPTGRVTIAGELTLEPSSPAAGSMVSARATLSADRSVTLNRLIVKVRDEAGTSHDFPERVSVTLGTDAREVVLLRWFDKPGTYTYHLTYQLAGEWVDLPPWQQLTVH